VVVLFGTLQVQSFILTGVSECVQYAYQPSVIFVNRKEMLKET